MIKTRNDLKFYLSEDKKASRVRGGKYWLSVIFNPRMRFVYNLRKYEYWGNKNNMFAKFVALWFYLIHKHLSYKLGYTIYKNNFGPGLFLAHYGTIVINESTRIGSHAIIHVCTNIGGKGTIIGDNFYMGPGAKIIKPVKIGNNVKIGANAVVNHDIPDDCIVAGIPAQIIKRYNRETGSWDRV